MKAAARRRGQNPRVIDSGRTLIMELEDASFLAPFCGTHRVQHIPKGAAARHTSTASVALLDAGSGGFELVESDLHERFTRGMGNGGQNRNTSDNCVVLTHVPTGLSVRIDGRSQWNNRQEARIELVRRLREESDRTNSAAMNARRNDQISAERSAKSFTHNEQRDEVVDHSTGKKWKRSAFLKGKF